jgi:Xaa-Pro dipeptidase
MPLFFRAWSREFTIGEWLFVHYHRLLRLLEVIMISRRHFLELGTTSAAAAALGAALPASAEQAPLPPAIAKLTSMRSEAKPITVEERRARIEHARELLAANHLDALMITGGSSLGYFTGMRWWQSERLFAFVLPAKGTAFHVCPKFEEERAREQISRGPLGGNSEVRTWEEDESPYQVLARGLADRGIRTGNLGIEETVPFVFSDGVSKAAPALKLVSGTPVTAGCRMLKSEHELQLMRLAAKVSLLAYKAAYESLHDGMNEDEFANLVSSAHKQLGFNGGADVQTGIYSALPHGSLTPQVIREGTILLMDGGCRVEGYSSDISRTFVLGKPTDKMKRVFDIVLKAQTAAVKTARPGLAAGEVDAAARKIIIDAGFGPGYRYFSHRVGHGLGLDGHEWAYLVRGNTLKLQPNMTFSDEPGIYIKGEFGVRLEDDMVITDNGAELMTPQSTSLEEPFKTV